MKYRRIARAHDTILAKKKKLVTGKKELDTAIIELKNAMKNVDTVREELAHVKTERDEATEALNKLLVKTVED